MFKPAPILQNNLLPPQNLFQPITPQQVQIETINTTNPINNPCQGVNLFGMQTQTQNNPFNFQPTNNITFANSLFGEVKSHQPSTPAQPLNSLFNVPVKVEITSQKVNSPQPVSNIFASQHNPPPLFNQPNNQNSLFNSHYQPPITVNEGPFTNQIQKGG